MLSLAEKLQVKLCFSKFAPKLVQTGQCEVADVTALSHVLSCFRAGKKLFNAAQPFYMDNQQAPSRHCQNLGHYMELMQKLQGCVVAHVLILHPFRPARSKTYLFGIP